MKRIGVLISGRGSNLQALIDAQAEGALGAELVLVISNRSDALGLKRAQKAGIATRVITKREYPDRDHFDEQVLHALREYRVDLVVLAGFMRVLGDTLITAFPMRMINIHPSLLPAFKGANAHKDALDYGVKVSGCSTHFVTADVDSGPIILQKAVPVFPDDTPETLADRVLKEEHKIIVRSVRLFCEDRLSVEGRTVRIGEE
ncbi:MAG: phosphoribosylglycinamide formyltransferase [Candidatus Thorarchaeota archaeon]|nr:MAG: phosphoribosylglycinamide formyltransferase [Candidatus Thorarchaeota archaeon]RLI58387.1 MAG: phosphoribosylglycinamide formyltransferase [Candidatus Thorarchaeota archaeon]